MNTLQSQRNEVARITQRGIGMTLAACLYWLGLAMVTAWSGWQPRALGLFLVLGTTLVYPLGWLLTRWCGGDLFARGHPLAGLIAVFAFTQVLGWPLLAILFLRDIALLAFAVAILLGAHFLPFGWLYRSRTYAVLGVLAVLVATLLQWRWPLHGSIGIPLAMALLYALAAGAVWRENRRAR